MSDQQGRPLLASLGLHLAVLLLAVFGLPHFSEDIVMTAAPVPVEIVTPDQMSSAPPKQQLAPAAAKPPPEPPVVTPPPPPPPVPDEIPVPQKEPPPKKEPPKKEPPKPEPPKKDPPKKDPPKKEPPKKEPPKKNNQFSSLLDNLADQADPKPPREGVRESPVEDSPSLSQLLNSSELDAVRQQVMGCWLEPTGLREGEQMVVEVQVQVNQDRTVRTAKVLNSARMGSDPFYRTLAESAVRAMYNPRCSPLLLPEGKYSTWKTITFRFAPGNIY